MRDGEGLRLVPSTRHGGARRHLRPVSGCDSSVMCCGPDHVPNSAAAARNGQSGICSDLYEDVSSIFAIYLTFIHNTPGCVCDIISSGSGWSVPCVSIQLTLSQHAKGHTKHKTFTPRTHHTR